MNGHLSIVPCRWLEHAEVEIYVGWLHKAALIDCARRRRPHVQLDGVCWAKRCQCNMSSIS